LIICEVSFAQYQEYKFVHVGLAMKTSTRVWMPFLVGTISICQWEKLNVVEGSVCNSSHPTWKLTFRPMATKVSQIASWILVYSLLWMQHKRWIPIGSMGCVYRHRRILAIEGWSSPNCVWINMEKNVEDNWKVEKIRQVVSQTPALGPKHDKIRARWASNIVLKNMLEKVW
jgi:hypothetical protein